MTLHVQWAVPEGHIKEMCRQRKSLIKNVRLFLMSLFISIHFWWRDIHVYDTRVIVRVYV